MGIYFNAVLADGNRLTSYCPHDYDNLSKLMEHSWVGNDFVDLIAAKIYNRPKHVWWVGDSCKEKMEEGGLSDIYEKAWISEQHNRSLSEKLDISNKFLVNHDTKEFIDMNAYIRRSNPDPDKWSMICNPLPLLTTTACVYSGRNEEYVGTWIGNRISYKDKAPRGYTEFPVSFVESFCDPNPDQEHI